MNTSGSARTPRRIGWWRILAGIWTAMTLAGVMLIVAPLVLPPSHGTAQRAHFTPASQPTFPTNGTPQSNGGAQEPVPLWITAPKATIAGPIIPVGVDTHGAMDAPEGALSDPVWSEAFWWRGGVLPGQPGNAVIGGHLDRPDGSPALFWNLRQLAEGDSVVVRTAQGTTLHFTVTAVQAFANPTGGATDPVIERIFGPAQTAHLNLITCTGTWTGTEYTKKLVVFTTLVP